MVGSRGFEPRSARSERAASANCATSRVGGHGRTRTATGQALDLPPLPGLGYMAIGPSGWTRTTTPRVKSPACCVDTHEKRELEPNGRDSNRRTSRLGRPAGAVTPHSRLVRPTGIEPVPPRWHRGMLPPHPGRTGPVSSPAFDILQLSKTPLLRAGGQQGIRTQTSPRGERVLQTRQRTIRTYCPCWRQRQDSNLDPRDLEARMLPLHHAAVVDLDRSEDAVLPPTSLGLSRVRGPKQKRPSRGSP